MALGKLSDDKEMVEYEKIENYQFLLNSKFQFKTIDSIFELKELVQGYVEYSTLSNELKDHISKHKKDEFSWFVVQSMFSTYSHLDHKDKVNTILPIRI